MMSNLPFEELIFFLDDLLLGSDDVRYHLIRLRHILQRFKIANMKLSPTKCHFLRRQVNFIGITIDKEGLTIDRSRVQSLQQIKSPHNKKSLQKLLGFYGFNRRWIPKYAALTKCMYDLLRKDAKFDWTEETEECEKNLEQLKTAVSDSICLVIPDLEDPLQSYNVVTSY